jgi:hypothetical protein
MAPAPISLLTTYYTSIFILPITVNALKYRHSLKLSNRHSPGVSPYKGKKNEKMGYNDIFVKQFFPKKIVEKNSAMAVF